MVWACRLIAGTPPRNQELGVKGLAWSIIPPGSPNPSPTPLQLPVFRNPSGYTHLSFAKQDNVAFSHNSSGEIPTNSAGKGVFMCSWRSLVLLLPGLGDTSDASTPIFGISVKKTTLRVVIGKITYHASLTSPFRRVKLSPPTFWPPLPPGPEQIPSPSGLRQNFVLKAVFP